MSDDKIGLFDFLEALSYSKVDYTTHERFEKDYSPFVINRWLTMTPDDHCINMGMFLSGKNLDKVAHYKFLLYELPAKVRYFKHPKKKNNFEEEDLEIIQRYYNTTEEKARELLLALTREQINEIKKI